MDDFKDIHVGKMVMYATDGNAYPAIVTEIFPGGRLNLTVFGLRQLGATFVAANHGLPEKDATGVWRGQQATWHRRVSSGVDGGGE